MKTKAKPKRNKPSVSPVPFRELERVRVSDIVNYLRISRPNLTKKRASGEFPRHDYLDGKIPYWKPATVIAYLESKAV